MYVKDEAEAIQKSNVENKSEIDKKSDKKKSVM